MRLSNPFKEPNPPLTSQEHARWVLRCLGIHTLLCLGIGAAGFLLQDPPDPLDSPLPDEHTSTLDIGVVQRVKPLWGAPAELLRTSGVITFRVCTNGDKLISLVENTPDLTSYRAATTAVANCEGAVQVATLPKGFKPYPDSGDIGVMDVASNEFAVLDTSCQPSEPPFEILECSR